MEQHIRKLKSEQAQVESDLAVKRLKSHNIESSIVELSRLRKLTRNSEFHRTVRKVATEVATQILQNRNIDRIEARVAISKVSEKTQNFYQLSRPLRKLL